MLGAIEAGAGIGFVSRYAVGRQLAAGSLVLATVRGLSIRRDLLLLAPAGPEPAGSAGAMLELLRQHRRRG
jgi:DNA-binding transcriptional LysR family regulator